MIPTIIISLILGLAVISHDVGAPEILGSFAAGIALARRFFLPLGASIDHYSHELAEKIEESMTPIIDLFVPVFFVMVGVSINLRVVDMTSPAFWGFAGALTIAAGHLHPLNYTLGLAGAAQAAGARIFEATVAGTIEHGSTVRIDTPAGRVLADHVILTRGGYLDGVHTPADWRVMPVGTYVVATEPLGEARIRELVRENYAVADVNFVLDYFRRSADHRMLFRGRVSYSGIDARNTGRATRARMLRVFPQLQDARLDYVWGGYVDITMNRAPDFGQGCTRSCLAAADQTWPARRSPASGRRPCWSWAGRIARYWPSTPRPSRS